MNYKKYINPMNYIHRLDYIFNQYFLHYFECLILRIREDSISSSKPIFIIGAPRSGSTLLTQVLLDAFDLGCLCNRHAKFYGTPVIFEKYFHPLRDKKPSDYLSNYGAINAPWASSECGSFWYRFFRRNPAYVTETDVSDTKMQCFRRSINALSKLQGRPILFKNLYATLRIRAIAKYIPEALFIIIKRDEVDNAHSILHSRIKNNGNYCDWWSVPPPSVDFLKMLPPEEQAVEQVRSINNLIEKDIKVAGIDDGQVLTFNYEEFCDDVHGHLGKAENFFQENELKVKRLFTVPSSFSRIKNMKIDPELYQKLLSYSKNSSYKQECV